MLWMKKGATTTKPGDSGEKGFLMTAMLWTKKEATTLEQKGTEVRKGQQLQQCFRQKKKQKQ